MGRVFGREGLDRALEERFKPYNYEPTRPTLRWLFIGLLAFIGVGVYALVTDMQFRNTLREWQSDGISQIPPSSEDAARALFAAEVQDNNPDEVVCTDEERSSGSVLGQSCSSMDRIFEFTAAVGLDCSTPQQLASALDNTGASPDCDRVVDVASEYSSLSDRSNIATYILILVLMFTAFPFSTFTHRSSRNLRTMKSEGQKYSPDGAVTRFFIPILNLVRPMQVFVEMFKASDPRVPEGDPQAWKKKGNVPPIAIIWGLLWPAMLIFNPILVQRAWFNERTDLSDVERTASALMFSDAIVIALGVAAILMARSLSAWQDVRAAKYGTVTVTPPRPKDPLEKALEEGIRRRDAQPQSREQDVKRRK
jgi:hypothetical protein